jgi:hypothetical protein
MVAPVGPPTDIPFCTIKFAFDIGKIPGYPVFTKNLNKGKLSQANTDKFIVQ